MDLSLTYLIDAFETQELSLTHDDDVLYSFSKDDDKRPSLVSYFFSNFATEMVLGSMAGSEQQEEPLDGGNASWIWRGGKSWRYERQDKEELKRKVNTWLQKNTRGLIRGIVEIIDIGSDTLDKIHVGALAFEGEWSVPFIDAGRQDFTPLCGDKIQMPFMSSTEEEHYVQIFKNFTLLSIPYKQFNESAYEMMFFLPDVEYGDMILRDFIDYCETVIDDVILTKQKVSKLLIPKFTLNTRMMMKNTSPRGKVRSTLTIDETGTRAASVTAYFLDKGAEAPSPSEFARDSTPPGGIQILVNRPFVFVIREDRSGTMVNLFTGALVFPYCNDGF